MNRIILLEDDIDIAALIEEVLRLDGHTVQTMIRLEPGDPVPGVALVISDLVDLRGYDPVAAREWVERIRRHFPDAKVLLATAHSGAARAGATALGVDAFMAKPFDANEFSATVALLLTA